MKLHHSVLFRQHPKYLQFRKERTRHLLVALTMLLVAAAAAVFLYIVPQRGPMEMQPFRMQLFGFLSVFAAPVCGLWGILKLTMDVPYLEIKAMEKVGELARAFDFADARHFAASRSVEEIRRLGRTKLVSMASSILQLEKDHEADDERMQVGDMKVLLHVAVMNLKKERQGRINSLYDALLDFGLIEPGGVGEFYNEAEEIRGK